MMNSEGFVRLDIVENIPSIPNTLGAPFIAALSRWLGPLPPNTTAPPNPSASAPAASGSPASDIPAHSSGAPCSARRPGSPAGGLGPLGWQSADHGEAEEHGFSPAAKIAPKALPLRGRPAVPGELVRWGGRSECRGSRND